MLLRSTREETCHSLKTCHPKNKERGMGIFDFLGNVGAKVFGKGEKEEEAIAELLNKDLPGKIQNLKVDFNDGVVTLTGACDTYATREKAILLAGNVTGVKQGDDKRTSPPKEEATGFYTVKSGDFLSKN